MPASDAAETSHRPHGFTTITMKLVTDFIPK